MTNLLPSSSEDQVVNGQLLSYVRAEDALTSIDLTGLDRSPISLLLRGATAAATARRIRASTASPGCIGIDTAAWTKGIASSEKPMELPPDDGLYTVGLEEWADGLLRGGADFVLTPSLLVRQADWLSLRCLLNAAAPMRGRDDVLVLIATEAAMLDSQNLAGFLRALQVHGANYRFAFTFADRERPLAKKERLAGLRAVLARFPGSLLVGTEVLAAMDTVARGGSAAVGLTGSLRRPRRPWDNGGGPPAKDFVPGLFLRDLWETRSPRIYADWYANSQAPTCSQCGGRAVDRFTSHPLDRQRICQHNVHAWLGVLDEITGRDARDAQRWLAEDRVRGLSAHLTLNAATTQVRADPMLRAYCELDDRHGRRIALNGSWR